MPKTLTRTELKIIAGLIASKIREEAEEQNQKVIKSRAFVDFEKDFPKNHRALYDSFETALGAIEYLSQHPVCIEFSKENSGSYRGVDHLKELLDTSYKAHISFMKSRRFKIYDADKVKQLMFPLPKLIGGTDFYNYQRKSLEEHILDELTIEQLKSDIDINEFMGSYVTKLKEIFDAQSIAGTDW